jgi:hypothetical protein
MANNLGKAGWSWGCVSAVDSNGRTIWIADAHRDNGKRLVGRAGEKLTACRELESVIQLSLNHLFQLHPSIPGSRQRQSWCRRPRSR